MAKTKKRSKSRATPSKSRVLTVDSKSKLPALEKILKSGKITIVLVFADWCPHCHTFRDEIWDPMCKGPAINNRVAVRDDMVRNSQSLANAKFNYLPSVLVVNEKGQVENFETESGESTNAMPTPKSLDEMTRVVNVNAKPLEEVTTASLGKNTSMRSEEDPSAMNNSNSNNFNRRYNSPMTTPDVVTLSSTTTPLTPSGKTFTPAEVEETVSENSMNSVPEFSRSSTIANRTPTPYPQRGGSYGSAPGGALLSSLQQVSQGILPVAFLGSLSMALKGGRRSTRRGRGRGRRSRRMIRA